MQEEIAERTKLAEEREAEMAKMKERIAQQQLWLDTGGMEGEEFIRQTIELAENWSAKGMKVEPWVMKGKHHFTTINQYLDAESDLAQSVRNLCDL